MIIDAHVHVFDEGFWPPRWLEYAAYSWAYAKPPYRDPAIVRPKIEAGLIDPDGSNMVADMDAAGVDMAVIQNWDWGVDFDQEQRVPLEKIHQHAAKIVKKHPGRFIAFASVDPRRRNARDLLEWALRDLGMKGLKLYLPVGFYPYDKAAYSLYEICEAHGLPVSFHTGEALPITSPRFANPLFLHDVQIAFPRLIIWVGHSGARLWWDEAVSVVASGVNSYLDLSVWIWDDTTEEEKATFLKRLAQARDRVGAHRLLFSSDHVSGSRVRGRAFLLKIVQWFKDLPEQAKRYGITFTEEEMSLILGGNAARCLGLSAEQSHTQSVAPVLQKSPEHQGSL